MKNELTKTVFGNKLNCTYTLSEAITMLHSMDMFNIGELAERAISKKSKVPQCAKNTPDADLINGKEIKHAQTHPENPQGNTLPAYITKRNKQSQILGVVTEQLTGKQYYFNIPFCAYNQASANTLSIPFELDGTPRKEPKAATFLPNWWDYEVKSFSELCKIAKQ
jgi:hypothetical protein